MTLCIIGIFVVVVGFGIVLLALVPRRRSQRLRETFGAEYGRTLNQAGDRHKAEAELEAREERVEKFNIRPLSAGDHDRFANAWQTAQARFVDDPPGAISEADVLIGEVMRTRGYLVGDFETRAADLSVHHPNVVTNYRMAHQAALKNEQHEAGTDELRQAMIRYRALFDELLGAQKPATEVVQS